jgi:flagellar motor switch protein FliM
LQTTLAVEPILDAAELEAIREAISQANPPTSPRAEYAEPRDAVPIALIADDRAAARARPEGLKLAERWADLAQRRVPRVIGAKLEVATGGAETVEGVAVREDLAASWLQVVEVSGRPGSALVAASGPMVESLAARLLGAEEDVAARDRAPSATTLGLFAPVGEAFATALAEVWRAEQGCEVTAVRDPARIEAWRRGIGDSDVVVVVSLSVAGSSVGRVRLIARPDTLVPPPVPVEAVPAPPDAIDEALGGVPIEVRVEFGRVRMPMSEFAALRPGALITLPKFVDDVLPVSCAGILKAFGRALVFRDSVAVEVAEQARNVGGAKVR